MQVLIVSYESPPNCAGIGYALQRLVDAFHRQGFEPDVLAGNHSKYWLLRAVAKYWMSGYKSYDLIHIWGALPTVLLPIKNQPFIITAHGSDVPGRNPKYDAFFRRIKTLYAMTWYRAKAIYCVTKGLQDLIDFKFDLPSKIIPNGVTFKDVNRPTPQYPMMVTTGRLITLKRTEILIDMMQSIPNGHLTIVGDGPEMQALHGMSIVNGVKSQVQFLGWTDPRPHLEAANIYVSAADATGVPLAMYEAMEYRLPLVVAKTPGLKNINCVPCEASPEHMAGGIVECLDQYQNLIEQPYVKTWDDIAREYICEYVRITNDRQTNKTNKA